MSELISLQNAGFWMKFIASRCVVYP